MAGTPTLTWRGSWPRLTWISLALAVLLIGWSRWRNDPLLATGRGLIAGALLSLRQRSRGGSVTLSESGISSEDGTRIAFEELARVSDFRGQRCRDTRESAGVDCWLESNDGKSIRIAAAAAPERREWLSSLSRWLEKRTPDLPEAVAAWVSEQAGRHGSLAVHSASVVRAETIRKRAGSSWLPELLTVAAASLAISLVLRDLSGGLGWILVPLALAAFVVLRRILTARCPWRNAAGGLAISPDGLRLTGGGKDVELRWGDVQSLSVNRFRGLTLDTVKGPVWLPDVFSERPAELERLITVRIRH